MGKKKKGLSNFSWIVLIGNHYSLRLVMSLYLIQFFLLYLVKYKRIVPFVIFFVLFNTVYKDKSETRLNKILQDDNFTSL